MPNWIANLKGGSGSGNFGHSGRPGKVGGSGSSINGSASKLKKNVKKSSDLGNQTDAVQKQCWKNSVMAVGLLDGAKYVEGYHVTKISDSLSFPIEHGWIEHNGEIIDVTLPDSIGNYYPAKKFTYSEIGDMLSKGETYLPFTNGRDPAMQRAMNLANKDAFGFSIDDIRGIGKSIPSDKIFNVKRDTLSKKDRSKLDESISIKGKMPKKDVDKFLEVEPSTKALPLSWRPWSAFDLLLFATINSALEDQLESILEDLNLRQSADNLLSDALWLTLASDFIAKIEPDLISLTTFSTKYAVDLIEDAAISVNWNLINTPAVEWASQYAASQVTMINEVTREALRTSISDWAAAGETLPMLADRIELLTDQTGTQLFSRERAERIAITENTQVFANANKVAWEELGYGKVVYQPTAHVRCRCYMLPNIEEDNAKVIVWYTANDERVCIRPIDTETVLGTVKGCRELHGMVVSEGEHLGEHNFVFGELDEVKSIKGGPGSGNFGHAGRPGEVGGSSKNKIEIRGKPIEEEYGDSTGFFTAWDGDESVGRLNFGIPTRRHLREQGYEIELGWANVPEDYQRKGIASQLMDSFFNEHGDKKIAPFETTPDGKRFMTSYFKKNNIPYKTSGNLMWIKDNK